MTSDHPAPRDEAAVPALPGDRPAASRAPRASVGLLPLALVLIVVLLFVAAAWTLITAGG